MDAIDEVLERARRLPADAVAAVFRRYGKPLEVALPAAADDDRRAELAFAAGTAAAVRAVEVRTRVDVIGNHWFVLESSGDEPLAMPGPLLAAALAALSSKSKSE
ncbi:MAG TPA: hypothetical protein VFF06_36390 [Polyangia bacterium]|nr:hypothetical protein [Polyangia bacterium]